MSSNDTSKSRNQNREKSDHAPVAGNLSTNPTGKIANQGSNLNKSTKLFSSRTLILSVFIGLLLSSFFGKGPSRLPTDYGLCSKEGKIYTVDDQHPLVECIVVHGNRIVDTDSLENVRKRWGDRDTTGPASFSRFLPSSSKSGLKIVFVDKGHIVVPGLADAHGHIIEHGFKRQLELDDCKSKEEVLKRVEEYITSRPPILNTSSVWIRGWGWDQTKWSVPEYPVAADFDAIPILRGRPIALRRIDGHSTWVSSEVLKHAGDLPQEVEGGEIIRDEHGNPTGVFVDNAQALIKTPDWTDEQLLLYFVTAVKEILSYGLTSAHDAWTTPQMIRFYKKIADENKLPLRLYLMGNVESSEYWGDQIDRFINYGPVGRLTLRSVKLFADGALGSWGAALLEPYTDKPESTGLLLQSPDVLSSLVKRFWDDGFQVNIHCIGDRANKLVLDIFEGLLKKDSAAERRPRIEHTQIIKPEDVRRLGALGVIPSVQPTHATSDMWYAESRLGQERLNSSYVYRSLLEYGGLIGSVLLVDPTEYSSSHLHVLPLGSDFPVEGVNPLLGFYAAISRLSVDGDSPHGKEGWFAEQRLTRAQALKGMTLDPAYASFNEDQIGSLTPGKLADYVVLDTDIMTVDKSRILQTKVVATVIDGRPAFGSLL